MQKWLLFWTLILFPWILFTTNVCWALMGGPDSYGYTFIDSNEAGTDPFSWVEIESSGNELNLVDNQISGPISLGFQFTFYGHTYSQVYVSSNGFLSFNTSSGSACCQGQPIPSGTDNVNNIIAALWDDIDPSG